MMLSQEEIKQHTEQAAKTIHAQQAWLFGSYARGEATENSDVDVLFVIEEIIEPRVVYIQLARKALRNWKVAKDIVVYDQEEFLDWGKVVGALCHTVKREGVVLYEA